MVALDLGTAPLDGTEHERQVVTNRAEVLGHPSEDGNRSHRRVDHALHDRAEEREPLACAAERADELLHLRSRVGEELEGVRETGVIRGRHRCRVPQIVVLVLETVDRVACVVRLGRHAAELARQFVDRVARLDEPVSVLLEVDPELAQRPA